MYPGSWKLEKIEELDFCQFSCTRSHQNRKKLRCRIFVNFRVPGVIKIGKKWGVGFLLIFVYPGSWKSEKIEVLDFCQFSCTRGHENRKKLKCRIFVNFRVPGVMKIGKNWGVGFLSIFVYPRSSKSEKIEVLDFC